MSGQGIVSIGTYIPRLRLSRKAIVDANSWANPNLAAYGKGTRAMCSHDEDSITMAVAAARETLQTATAPDIDAVSFASTTAPFADRQNAAVIGEALALSEHVHCTDTGGSLRAGSSALINALEKDKTSLVIAADKRKTRPASLQELIIGDGAAGVLTGKDNLLAGYIGSYVVSVDLTDHYRAQESQFDYSLEERWVRDEGYLKIIPAAITSLLAREKVSAENIAHLVIAGPDRRTAETIAKQCGIASSRLTDNLRDTCGDTGSAHSILMLAHALEQAGPDELILVAGFGQGCDVVLFRTTDKVSQFKQTSSLQRILNCGKEDTNYQRYLSFNGLLELDWGMRAERDNRTAQSAFYRHRRTVTAFIGGRCQVCDTPQFPKKPLCANPECRRANTQIEEPFKDKPATVKSFTEDWLALSYNPPIKYGNVRFDGGGIVMMEFADFDPGELDVGTRLSMQFRIKEEDPKRGFKRYCWKATPLLSSAATTSSST